jgi:hypothetical protein
VIDSLGLFLHELTKPGDQGPHGGYWFYSGVGGSFIFSIPSWVIVGWLFFYRHNCHVHRCLRLQWHVHPESGHPVCKKHHPDRRM